MTIRVGETGKKIYVVTSFDMSSNTLLQIIAVPPSGEANQKTWTATIDAVGFASVTLEDGTSSGAVAANASLFYTLANTTDLDEVGDWTLVAVYTNTSTTPDEVFKSDPVTLSVLSDNYAA